MKSFGIYVLLSVVYVITALNMFSVAEMHKQIKNKTITKEVVVKKVQEKVIVKTVVRKAPCSDSQMIKIIKACENNVSVLSCTRNLAHTFCSGY